MLRYGIISTAFVIFTQVFTDFGVPKVIGGNYNVLATDIYKEVVGMQNFQMGAVISMVLLIPAMIAFLLIAIQEKNKFLYSLLDLLFLNQKSILRLI